MRKCVGNLETSLGKDVKTTKKAQFTYHQVTIVTKKKQKKKRRGICLNINLCSWLEFQEYIIHWEVACNRYRY